MKFAHPEILWALFALAIPVIVHLFNFRRFKRIVFTNVAFLKEVQQETKSKSRLRHLLILSARLLAMAAIVFAFAQPYIPVGDNDTSGTIRTVSVYIDNSFSMEAESRDGRLLDLAKEKAIEVVSAYQATDKFQLLTNDFEGRHQRLNSQEDVLEMIDDVQASNVSRKLGDVVQRQQDLLLQESEGAATIYVFSDLQKSSHDIEGFTPDSLITVNFLPEQAVEGVNCWVDSVWFDTPVRLLNQPEILRLRIRSNTTEQLENIPMSLSINGAGKTVGSFSISPESYTDTALFFTNTAGGFIDGTLSIQDHPVVYDDSWYFGYEVAKKIRVLSINGENKGEAIRSIFGNDPFYEFESVDSRNVEFGNLNSFDFIILNEVKSLSSGLADAIIEGVNDGGSAFIIPAVQAEKGEYNRLLDGLAAPQISEWVARESKVANINLDHELYKGVFEKIPGNIDLPITQGYYGFSSASRSSDEELMRLQDGSPFIFEVKTGAGRAYVSAVPLTTSISNLVQHAIFVPTTLRMAEFSKSSGITSFTIGSDQVVKLKGNVLVGDQTYTMQSADGGLEFIPGYRQVHGHTEIFMQDQNTGAGNYHLMLGDSVVSAIGLNYDRNESKLEAYDIAGWKDQLSVYNWNNANVVDTTIETVSNTVEQLESGKKLWDRFIWLALIALVIELLLIKLWKS